MGPIYVWGTSVTVLVTISTSFHIFFNITKLYFFNSPWSYIFMLGNGKVGK